MLRSILLLSFICLISGCQKSSSSTQARYYEDGRLKPSVAFVPIIDSTNQTHEWNLTDEITNSLVYRLTLRDKLYLCDQNEAFQLYGKLGATNNPFGNQIDWVKQACPDKDFAVFMELIEHEEIPLLANRNDDPEQCAAQLNISLRVRVIDLRANPPKIVLQEILHDKHQIPRQFTKYHFHQVPAGEISFAISPIGLAHAQLVKEVSSRIEEYILTAPAPGQLI